MNKSIQLFNELFGTPKSITKNDEKTFIELQIELNSLLAESTRIYHKTDFLIEKITNLKEVVNTPFYREEYNEITDKGFLIQDKIKKISGIVYDKSLFGDLCECYGHAYNVNHVYGRCDNLVQEPKQFCWKHESDPKAIIDNSAFDIWQIKSSQKNKDLFIKDELNHIKQKIKLNESKLTPLEEATLESCKTYEYMQNFNIEVMNNRGGKYSIKANTINLARKVKKNLKKTDPLLSVTIFDIKQKQIVK
jgi:hypothetical protein